MLYFQLTHDAEMVPFLDKKVRSTGRSFDSFCYDPRDGLERMRKGRFAFYCEEVLAENLVPKFFSEHEMCDTKQVQLRRHFIRAFILKKFSPFRERFLLNWLKILETGTSDRTLKYWQRKKITCDLSAHFASVRLEYMSSALIILLVAYVISILILVVEMLTRAFSRV